MYIKIDCACIGVIFDSTLVLLIILLTLDGVGLKIKLNMRNDGHFGQFKTFSKKCQHIWMERVTFHNVPVFIQRKSIKIQLKK